MARTTGQPHWRRPSACGSRCCEWWRTVKIGAKDTACATGWWRRAARLCCLQTRTFPRRSTKRTSWLQRSTITTWRLAHARWTGTWLQSTNRDSGSSRELFLIRLCGSYCGCRLSIPNADLKRSPKKLPKVFSKLRAWTAGVLMLKRSRSRKKKIIK